MTPTEKTQTGPGIPQTLTQLELTPIFRQAKTNLHFITRSHLIISSRLFVIFIDLYEEIKLK